MHPEKKVQPSPAGCKNQSAERLVEWLKSLHRCGSFLKSRPVALLTALVGLTVFVTELESAPAAQKPAPQAAGKTPPAAASNAVKPASATATPPALATPTPAALEFFEREVRPILATACYSCHSERAQKKKGDLTLDTWEGISRGGNSGPAIIPGEPDKSPLITGVRWTDANFRMPPKEKLTSQALIVIERWVKMGAPYPRSAPVASASSGATSQGFSSAEMASAKAKWQFQPLREAAEPKPNGSFYEAFSTHPIDRILARKWEAKGILPPPLADKRTLLRRATFDLTGLPPTAAEMHDFMEDKSPEAYSKALDRLLASHAYGERWGRHWMDVVRYADTAGDGADYPIPEARLYRDYIINTFNADKPYPRFIREQIAGDLLPYKSDEERKINLIATGYIASSRRFGSVPDMFLTVDDTIDNIGKGFLGLTLSCARCHNHKFDPISMRDYYGLFGFFSSTTYPAPGSELSKQQKDFVPIFPREVAEKIMAPYQPKLLEFQHKLDELAKRRQELNTTQLLPEFGKVLKEISAVEHERNKYEETLPKLNYAYAVSEGIAHDEQIHLRGEPFALGETVPRHFPELLGGQTLPPDQVGKSGRLALADWIADPKNPLTLRVFVNRVWGWHFGRPLVETPNDWGKQWRPTQFPELVDYLATSLTRTRFSLKALHKFIMLSKAYQMSSEETRPNVDIDPANELFSRFIRQRHDAESIRDSILAVSGQLDLKTPDKHPFPSKDKWAFTTHDPFSDLYENSNRAVYQMQKRLTKHPFFELFDGADTNACNGVRGSSTTPLQALYFLNDPWIHEQSKKMVDLICQVSGTPEKRIPAAFLLAFNRRPTEEETIEAEAFIKRYSEKLKASQSAVTPKSQAAQPALDDQKAMQGDWVCVREENQGQPMGPDKLANMAKKMNIDRDLLVIRRFWSGKLGSYEGTFVMDASASPKKIDFSGTGPEGKHVEFKGIYELSGDLMKLIYSFNGPRPTEFKTVKGTPSVYLQFKRAAQPAVSTANAPPLGSQKPAPVVGPDPLKSPAGADGSLKSNTPTSAAESDHAKASLAAFVRTLFATNEFLFIQ